MESAYFTHQLIKKAPAQTVQTLLFYRFTREWFKKFTSIALQGLIISQKAPMLLQWQR
jgi:hypothetical protein